MDATLSSLITAADTGDRAAAAALFETLYAELRRMAQRELARGAGRFVSLSVSSLLHEAYLVMGPRRGDDFPDAARFMAYAARVMRGLIIDHARQRRAQKRGGQFELTVLEPERVGADPADAEALTEISDALDELAKLDPALAEIVDLRFFCGFSLEEIAAMSAVSERTAERRWQKARLLLHRSLRAATLV